MVIKLSNGWLSGSIWSRVREEGIFWRKIRLTGVVGISLSDNGVQGNEKWLKKTVTLSYG